MDNTNSMRTAAAFAVTIGLGYTLCTLVFWAWPEAAMTFMNSLFHGLDFGKLQEGPTLFRFGSFFSALVGIVVWAFMLGAIFTWLQKLLADRG